MQLIENEPNWIQVNDEDGIPPTNEWEFNDLCAVIGDVPFQLHSCGKYTLIYRAEIILQREGLNVTKQELLIVEVECPRDGENLRYAGNIQMIDNLPVQSFTVYQLEHVAEGDS